MAKADMKKFYTELAVAAFPQRIMEQSKGLEKEPGEKLERNGTGFCKPEHEPPRRDRKTYVTPYISPFPQYFYSIGAESDIVKKNLPVSSMTRLCIHELRVFFRGEDIVMYYPYLFRHPSASLQRWIHLNITHYSYTITTNHGGSYGRSRETPGTHRPVCLVGRNCHVLW
jgi:hypothetical protein